MLIHCGNYMVGHKTYYIIKYCARTTLVLTLPNHNPLAQTAAFQPLPNIPPFYPRLVVPVFPSLAVACCGYLPACWLCVRVAFRINDRRREKAADSWGRSAKAKRRAAKAQSWKAWATTMTSWRANRDFICHVGLVFTVDEQQEFICRVGLVFTVDEQQEFICRVGLVFTVDERQGFHLPCRPCFHCWRANLTGIWSAVWALFTLLTSKQGFHLPCGPCFHCWRANLTGISSAMCAMFTLLSSKLNRDLICRVGLVYTVNEQTGISSAVWAMFTLLTSKQGFHLPGGPCFHCGATTQILAPVWAFFFFFQCWRATGISSPMYCWLESIYREFFSLVGLAFIVGEQWQGIHLPCGPCFHCWRATTGNSFPLWALLSLLASNDREFISLVGLAFTVGEQLQGGISREGLDFIFDEPKKPSLPDSFRSNLRTFLYLK